MEIYRVNHREQALIDVLEIKPISDGYTGEKALSHEIRIQSVRPRLSVQKRLRSPDRKTIAG